MSSFNPRFLESNRLMGNYEAKLPNKDQQAKYATDPNMYVLKTPKQASNMAQQHGTCLTRGSGLQPTSHKQEGKSIEGAGPALGCFFFYVGKNSARTVSVSLALLAVVVLFCFCNLSLLQTVITLFLWSKQSWSKP